MPALPWLQPSSPRDPVVTVAGAVSAVAGLALLAALPLPPSWFRYAVALVAVVGSVAPLAGLSALRVAGSGSGATAMQVWLIGYSVLVAALVLPVPLHFLGSGVQWVAAVIALPAALLVLVAGPVTAVRILQEGLLPGWRRWVPLALAIFQIVVMLPALGVVTPLAPLVLLMPLVLILAALTLLTASPDAAR